MLKSRPGSSRSYSPRRTFSPKKSSSRRSAAQTTKSRSSYSKDKKKSRIRDKTDKPAPKKQEDKKGESIQTFPPVNEAQLIPSFKAAWLQGAFSLIALSMITDLGLNIASAIDIACRPIAGRIKYCLDSWHKITTSNWVLKVACEGYRLQFKDKCPKLPYRVKNLPTSDDGASERGH